MNVETTRKYVYAFTSLNRILGSEELDKGTYTRITKALAAAKRSVLSYEPKQAKVFGLSVIRKIGDFRGRSTARVAVLFGLALALRVGELLDIRIDQITWELVGGEFVVCLKLNTRKNKRYTSYEKLACVVPGCSAELECPSMHCCPAHLLWSLKKLRELNARGSERLFDALGRDGLVIKLKSLLITVGELGLVGVSGYSIRRSSLQALFGLSVPEFMVHERAGWVWKDSQINRYLKESARALLLYSARWLIGTEGVADSLNRLGLAREGFLAA